MQALLFVRRHFTALSLIFYALGLTILFVGDYVRDRDVFAFLDIRITHYFVNYVEHWFSRRAVVGTLFFPVLSKATAPLFVANLLAILLNAACFLFLFLTLRRFFKRSQREGENLSLLP